MNASGPAKLIIAGAVGAVSAVGLVAFLNFVNGQDGFAACTMTTGPGWSVPLVVGAAIGGVVWSLMGWRADSVDSSRVDGATHCDSCGGMVLNDWRLCPHCGTEFEDVSRTGVTC